MSVLKFDQFINEAKKDKNSIVDLLVKLLKEKPSIKVSDLSVDQKGAYSMSAIKKYFIENEFTRDDADQAIYKIKNDKEFKGKIKLEDFSAKDFRHNKSYPYYYIGLSKDEANKIKDKYENESEGIAKPEMEKREETRKRLVSVAKEREASKAKRSTERKTPKKAPAKKAPAKKAPAKKPEVKK